MLFNLMICALTLGTPTIESPDEVVLTPADTPVVEMELKKRSDDEPEEEWRMDPKKEKFWAKRKAMRIGYLKHDFQGAENYPLPTKFGLSLTRAKSVWLHKKPIGNFMKFGFDHGLDINYTMFQNEFTDDHYTGPSGYMGPQEDLDNYVDEEESGPNLSSMGSHYISLGYALGVSLTINPVAQLRLEGYAHFVPSVGLQLSGTNLYLGFMPYLKYGCELSYGFFGVGVEWGTGVSKMSDMMPKLIGEGYPSKNKFYSNYTKIYVSFRMGKAR